MEIEISSDLISPKKRQTVFFLKHCFHSYTNVVKAVALFIEILLFSSDCGGEIFLDGSHRSQIITSPNYPNVYGTDMRCTYLIKVSYQSLSLFLCLFFSHPLFLSLYLSLKCMKQCWTYFVNTKRGLCHNLLQYSVFIGILLQSTA